MKKNIYIVGVGGFAAELTSYLYQNGQGDEIQGYFDISKVDYDKYQYKAPYLGSEDEFSFLNASRVFISIANPEIRNNIYKKLSSKKYGLEFPTFIHPSCVVSLDAKIDSGGIICPFVTITSNCIIGKNFQANIYSYIAHDCVIGDNVTFAPRVSCNGNVHIMDNVYIGTGAIIFQGKKDKPIVIGKGAVIAAGSVVTKSVPDNMTVFGNPAIEFTRENINRRS